MNKFELEEAKRNWKSTFLYMIEKGYHFDNNNLINGLDKIIKPHINSGGYPHNFIRHNGVRRCFKFHRLKAFFLYGDKIFDPRIKVRHRNDNKLDISDDNIILGTQHDNLMDVPKERRVAKALHAAKHKRKLTQEQANEIRKLYKPKIDKYQLAIEYGVDRHTITRIINFKTHNNSNQQTKKITYVQAVDIRKICYHITIQQLAKMYNVSRRVVHLIIHNKTYN